MDTAQRGRRPGGQLMGGRGHGVVAALGFLALLMVAPHPVAAQVPHVLMAQDALLNLTAPQQQQLSALEASSGRKADQLFAQIRQLRHKLFVLYGAYRLDAGAAAKLDQELNRVQGQLLDLRLSEQRQLRTILTAHQFCQLQKGIHQHGDWHDPHSRDHDPDAGDHDGDGPQDHPTQ